jgi:glycosyltransferase involved in cell wall biosynthesis
MLKSQKIKILHIIGVLGLGGCEKQLLELCKRLDKTQFELSLIWYSYMPGFKDTAYTMENAFKQTGIQTIHFDKFSMPLWKFILQLRNIIKSIDPDIVHTWLYSANFWGRWAALTCGVPRLFASYRVEVKENVDNNMVTRISERLLSSRTCKLANSRAVARSLEKYYGIPQNKIYIIYNAITDVPIEVKAARRDIRRELGVPEDEKIVLMVARQHKQKNYPMFIRVAKQVYQQKDAVTFIGVGRCDIMEELNAVINQYNIQHKVIFVGERDDVYRWLAAADVFCFTSDYEGFANAILEAMVAGLPVITTDFPGVEEIITMPDMGIIVPRNDDMTMAKEVIKILDNPLAAQHISRAAKISVMETFTWDKLLHKIQSLYQGMATDNHL